MSNVDVETFKSTGEIIDFSEINATADPLSYSDISVFDADASVLFTPNYDALANLSFDELSDYFVKELGQEIETVSGPEFLDMTEIQGIPTILVSWRFRKGEFGPYALAFAKVAAAGQNKERTATVLVSSNAFRALQRVTQKRMDYNSTHPERPCIVNAGFAGVFEPGEYWYVPDPDKPGATLPASRTDEGAKCGKTWNLRRIA